MKKVAVILSGCGVYDGSEIQESVLALLAIHQNGGNYQCFAPDVNQHHVINHITGNESAEVRNALVESARIARGEVKSLSKFDALEFDAMVIPGGFGTAKNLTTWAFKGPSSEINIDVKNAILSMLKSGKPICALCMGPTVIAKAVQNEISGLHLTVGSDSEKSPYEIAAISSGMNSIGVISEMKSVKEICVDEKYKIVTAPCYMMEASIGDVFQNIRQAIDQLFQFLK